MRWHRLLFAATAGPAAVLAGVLERDSGPAAFASPLTGGSTTAISRRDADPNLPGWLTGAFYGALDKRQATCVNGRVDCGNGKNCEFCGTCCAGGTCAPNVGNCCSNGKVCNFGFGCCQTACCWAEFSICCPTEPSGCCAVGQVCGSTGCLGAM